MTMKREATALMVCKGGVVVLQQEVKPIIALVVCVGSVLPRHVVTVFWRRTSRLCIGRRGTQSFHKALCVV
ncbi:hypothetical protein ABVT39_007524, partial [Epinephelus coioides]